MQLLLRRSLLFIFLLSFFLNTAQQRKKAEFGILDISDRNTTSYPADPEAAGVVLYERGKNYVKVIRGNVRLIKEVHRKIKVFDAKMFNDATVIIPFYESKNGNEKVTKLKAITHNGNLQTYLKEEDVYETNETESWSLKKFTFPNVKDGSILEYTYQIESPFFFYFDGWEFQGTLPKIYSEFVSEMPGNFIYRKSLIGTEKLDINKASLKKYCFSLPGFAQDADCEVGTYVMLDIPAFKKEDHMLASSNYSSKINFELMQYVDFRGIKHMYSKKWSDVDKEFRFNKDLGRQLSYSNFFKNNLPENIMMISDRLEKAKAIYYFIQKHYNWDGKFRILSDIRVKKAFEAKTGNSSEINLSLFNALKAADLTTKIVMISTRDNGIPTQLYPVLSDFNYAVTYLKIDDAEFLLDATDKYTPFGILPFRALNSIGRLLDFKKGSEWFTIVPNSKNLSYVNTQLTIDEDNNIVGKVKETFVGYAAIKQRKIVSKGDIRSEKEKLNGIEINDYTNENAYDLEENFSETYQIIFEPEMAGNDLVFYPLFLNNYFRENPFKLESRSYPVDFGHPMNNTYTLSLDLNGKYEINDLPKNKVVRLPDNLGECSVLYSVTNGKLNVRFTFKLRGYHFSSEKYQSLKDFFNTVVKIQTKEAIILKKL